ncbi:MAG: Cna B-type domain-containing protein, partial [Clostridia bacterium]|nr:Cna B-type domain-containing protein [Clostridia bacterium]
MLKTRSLKKAVSFLCVFCLLFSMLANGVIASADIGEAAAEEAAIGQSSSAGANEESLPDEDPEGDLTGSFEKPGDPAEAELPEEGGQDENEALTEAAAPEEKKSDFPPVEENASDDGNEAAPPCPQEEPAIGMEEAGAIGEAVPPAEASAGAREVRAAASSDLADFLVGVSIEAPMDENGNIVINPNCSYEMTLRFSENEGLQFDDEGVLFYNFPEGVLINDIGPTAFTLAVKDENGSAVVSDNLFEVVGGQLRVRFNQNDPNFARLKAMPNVQFDITISSSFDQTLGEIVFNENIVKDFVFEETSDLAIAKRVVYDKNSDTAYYELQIRSEGLNRNVVIEDRLIGTALHFNRDAVVESSVNGPLSVTPDYQAVENGFRVTIPQMVDGEVLTIRCSAAVDNNLITGSGTAAQTKNTATVVSDDVPEGKTAEADFAGQVDFQKIGKGKAGDPVSIGENRYTVPWTVRVNADHKLTIGGKTILDYVRSDSQQFMHFAGGGITMEVTFADGTTENRFVPWAALGTVSNENGIIRWEYDAPESDGNAAYLITYDTIIDAAGVPSETLTVTNRAQVESHYADASVTVGVIGNDQLLIRKDAVGTTSSESEWTITLTVPGSGLPDLRVVDDMPRLDHGGQTYIDDYVPDSMQIEGLQEGESWNLYVGTNGRSYTLTFYQDEAHVQRGVLPTADGEPRDIVIRFKTRVNQDWLNLAAEEGYNDFSLHRNAATARTGGYTSPTTAAFVIPVKPNLVKSVVERSNAEIDGVTYPVFRYSLALFGPVEDGIVIQDSFNTAYLKLFEAEGVWILGGNSYSPTDGNGIVSAVDTPEGMAITVTSFPKQANGSFYPYYLVDYSLIVRDAAALAALNEAAAASQNGIDLENTARWNDLLSARVVNYTYFPYVDKALLTRPTAENGYIAEFEVIINQYAEDLDPASDVLAIQDVLSPNLRLIHDSLTITPASNSLIVQYEEETNTLIFTEVPDETAFVIRYQARVLGTGNVTYSNTIKFGNYEKTIEETAVVDSSGGGTGSNPSITLVKRDSEMLSVLLAGATFQLFWLENGNPVPVQDGNGQDVTFTTGADGKALIVGNLQSLGWALWANRTYCLLETVSPPGYELNTEPIYFILTENPSSQIEFDITGDSLSVQNEAMKISVPVAKYWVGPAAANEVVVHLLADETDTEKTITLNAEGNWTGSFDNLKKYDDAGREIRYSVKEDPVNNYAVQYDGSIEEGFTITNINSETIGIPVVKQWVGTAAEQAAVRLLADGTVIEEITLDAVGGWQHTFTDLPKYDGTDGHEIQYDVQEAPSAGYEQSRSGSVETGFTFTNTITGRISIPVTKQWVGPAAERATIRLLADGAVIEEITLDAAGGWQHTFTDLPKYDGTDGHEIQYDVQEAPSA